MTRTIVQEPSDVVTIGQAGQAQVVTISELNNIPAPSPQPITVTVVRSVQARIAPGRPSGTPPSSDVRVQSGRDTDPPFAQTRPANQGGGVLTVTQVRKPQEDPV